MTKRIYLKISNKNNGQSDVILAETIIGFSIKPLEGFSTILRLFIHNNFNDDCDYTLHKENADKIVQWWEDNDGTSYECFESDGENEEQQLENTISSFPYLNPL
jgi:hypothetical protein